MHRIRSVYDRLAVILQILNKRPEYGFILLLVLGKFSIDGKRVFKLVLELEALNCPTKILKLTGVIINRGFYFFFSMVYLHEKKEKHVLIICY